MYVHRVDVQIPEQWCQINTAVWHRKSFCKYATYFWSLLMYMNVRAAAAIDAGVAVDATVASFCLAARVKKVKEAKTPDGKKM